MDETIVNQSGVVIIGNNDGHAVIPDNSPIKRLRYFDGRFLRATDMELGQRGLLNYSRLSNQAGGAGAVHGLSCNLVSNSDALNVSAGLAIDAFGNLLYLPQEITVDIQTLLDKSSNSSAGQIPGSNFFTPGAGFEDCVDSEKTEQPGEIVTGYDLYIIIAEYTNAYCGEDDVYGKLCEEACISSKERPYVIDGVLLRAIPLRLSALLPNSDKINLSRTHLRSRVAAAYFEQERDNPGSLISKEGLMSDLWCQGAEALAGAGVPLAILARAGTKTVFLDNWIARRERIDVPPKQYWAGRMAMRAWQVYLAHILQFQCQLRTIFSGAGIIDHDPCEDEREKTQQLKQAYERLLKEYERIANRIVDNQAGVAGINQQQIKAFDTLGTRVGETKDIALPHRMLIKGGIVELPSAGYLPVNATSNITVNEQVRRMMGEGVDLRFCVVRPDYVPHALEEAQHMERISLLDGLSDPAKKPQVDVLVPNGRIETYKPETPGTGYTMRLRLDVFGMMIAKYLFDTAMDRDSEDEDEDEDVSVDLIGAARGERLDSGGFGFYFAARQFVPVGITRVVRNLARGMRVADSATRSNTFTRIFTAVRTKSAESTEAVPVSRTTLESTAEPYVAQVEGEEQNDNFSFWVDFGIDSDLFKLSIGERARISATIVIAVVGDVIDGIPTDFVLKVEVSGALTVDDIVTLGNDVIYKCDMNAGGYAYAREIPQNGNTEEGTVHLNLNQPVEVASTDSGDVRPRISVRLPDLRLLDAPPGYQIGFERRWYGADRATVEAWGIEPLNATNAQPANQYQSQTNYSAQTDSVQSQAADTRLPILAGKQHIDANVLKPGNTYHATSLTALRIIGSALEDVQFADIAGRKLFPPPKQAPQELQIYARRDWALFHRRRNIVCKHKEVPEAELATRRYRLFHVAVTDAVALAVLRTALIENTGVVIQRFEPKAVTIVEYEAGLYSVRPPHDAVLAPWDTAIEGEAVIMLGAIASRDEAHDEGPALAGFRLERLTDLLGPVTELDEEGELLEPLSRIPGVLHSADVDGVIVLATASISTVCHNVYQVATDSFGALDDVGNEEEYGNQFAKWLVDYDAKLLPYRPRFERDTLDYLRRDTEARLSGAWDAVDDGGVLGIINAKQVDAAGKAVGGEKLAEQSRTIATSLSDSTSEYEIYEVSTTEVLPTCPVATVLAVAADCNPVYYSHTDPAMIDQLISLIEMEGIDNVLSPPPGMPDTSFLAGVLFQRDTSTVLNRSVTPLVNAWQALTPYVKPDGSLENGYSMRLISVSPNGSPTDEVTINGAQTAEIGAKINNPVGVEAIISGPQQTLFPFPCGAMTLVFFVVNTAATVAVPVLVAGTDAVASAEAFNFEVSSNALVKNDTFDTAMETLKAEGTVLKSIEVVTRSAPAKGASDPKAEALLLALKETGVADASATVTLRKATAKEGKLLTQSGTGVTAGLVLKQ